MRTLVTTGEKRKARMLTGDDDGGPDLAGGGLRFLPTTGAAGLEGGGDRIGESQAAMQVAYNRPRWKSPRLLDACYPCDDTCRVDA